MNVILVIAVFASVLFAWVCLFNIIPACLAVMFRYRLAKQRDELALEILKGEFEEPEIAEQMIWKFEGFIEISRQVTVFRALLARLACIGTPAPEEFRYGDMDQPERKVLERRLHAFNLTVVNHAFFETPSGWAFVLVLLLIAPIVFLIRRVRPSERTLSEELREPIEEGVRDLPPASGVKLVPPELAREPALV